MNPTRELFRAVGFSAASRAAALVTSLLINALLARTLSYSGFAFLGVLTSLSMVLIIILHWGFDISSVRAASETMHTGRKELLTKDLFSGIVMLFVTSTALLLSMMHIAPNFLPLIDGAAPDQVTLLLASVFVVMGALNILLAEPIRGLGKVGTSSSLTGQGQHGGIVRSTLLLLLLLLLFAFNAIDVKATLAVSALASLCSCWICLGVLRPYLVNLTKVRFRYIEFRRSVRSNSSIMIGQFMQMLASQHALMIVAGATLFGPTLALFVSANQLRNILTAPLTLFAGASPKLLIDAHRNQDWEQLERLLRLGATVALIFVTVATAVFFIVGESIFAVLFGPSYAGGSIYFLILAPGLIANAFSGTGARALLLLGFQRQFMTFASLFAMASIPIGFWAANTHGAIGLAIASSGTLVVQNLLLIWLVAKFLNVKSYAYLSPSSYLDIARHVLTWANRLRSRCVANVVGRS